ncbi:MAG: efflux RND transporter periplasmic adaptor subunit [Bacteroidetes Order II. Incertae sedis bacterium]|nr:efflux RND transporter periplasmic adaptor subunit [Bacteroidetes Order II. bacterium]
MKHFQYVVILPVSLMLAFVFSACNQGNKPASTAENSTELTSAMIPVETLLAGAGNFDNMIQIPGVVETSNDVTVSALSAGILQYVAPVGKYVSAGETVAIVDPAVAEAALSQAKAALSAAEAAVANAEAQLRLAEDAFRRQEPLYRDSIISALEFEGVKTRLAAAKAVVNQTNAGKAQAQAAISLAQKQLSNTRVVAPFSGKIERKLAEVGSTAAPGSPIVQIVNAGNVKITGGVSEKYAATVRLGTNAFVRFPTLGNQETIGSISFIGTNVNPTSRTFPIEIQVANPDGLLKPQMTAQIFINNETIGNVIVIPETAIMRDEEGTSVFIAKPEGRKKVAKRVSISIGPSQEGKTVVFSGINAGDEVVTNGQNNVSEGDLLEVVKG